MDYPLLRALDALGLSLGIEISRDGMIRLARLLGEEILNLYLRRYALKKIRLPEGEQYPLANDLLAQVVYAMYNAGPGALAAFLKRSQQGSLTHLDRLLDEKLQWVNGEDWEKIVRCY
jgi:chromosome condensin MukBEF MukE localization factor